MEKLRVGLGERSYDIEIGSSTLGGLGAAINERGGFSRRAALVSNPTVYGHYGAAVKESLLAAGFEVTEIIIPDGEQHKSLLWFERILAGMLRARLDRKSLCVALGGGVIGDITGFAASAYMRGIRFVQVPTTLLAQVDSSVGGKTGVNHELGKNMIGAFWQPSLVWIDTSTLRSLPRRELLAGLAEAIKYGVIWDAELFEYLRNNREAILALDPEPVTHIIRRSCEIKADVVAKDEREGGLRAILNYGHTIGHAVETTTGYTSYLHGEAVAIGMYAEARLSEALGFAGPDVAESVRAIQDEYGLPCKVPATCAVAALMDAMAVDKKTVSGQLRFVLPKKIGHVLVNEPVAAEDVEKLLSAL